MEEVEAVGEIVSERNWSMWDRLTSSRGLRRLVRVLRVRHGQSLGRVRRQRSF